MVDEASQADVSLQYSRLTEIACIVPEVFVAGHGALLEWKSKDPDHLTISNETFHFLTSEFKVTKLPNIAKALRDMAKKIDRNTEGKPKLKKGVPAAWGPDVAPLWITWESDNPQLVRFNHFAPLNVGVRTTALKTLADALTRLHEAIGKETCG